MDAGVREGSQERGGVHGGTGSTGAGVGDEADPVLSAREIILESELHEERERWLLDGLELAERATWIGQIKPDTTAEGEGPIETRRSLLRVLASGVSTALWNDTDIGSGAEFAMRNGWRLRWVQAENGWRVYDVEDRRWKLEDREGSAGFMKTTVLTRREAVGGPLKKADQAHAQKALQAAKSILAITPEAFDRFPSLVSAPNGVYDLETGRFYDHEPSMLLTKRVAAPIATGAKPGRLWLSHVDRLTGGNEEMSKLLQIAAGTALYGGSDKPQQFIFLRGQGRNGKGVFLRTIRAALGEYFAVVSKGILTQADDAIPHELLKLRNARIAAVLEAPRAKVNVASINNLTGGDELQGRRLHGNLERGFAPTFLPLWICGNENLELDGRANTSVWERCVFVDVGAPIPVEQRDDSIERRLKTRVELEGVLSWMLDGWRMFVENGRRIPHTAEGLKAIEIASERADHFGRFQATVLELCDDCQILVDDLQLSYDRWRQAQNFRGNEDIVTRLQDLVGVDNIRHDDEGRLIAVGVKRKDHVSSGFGAIIS